MPPKKSAAAKKAAAKDAFADKVFALSGTLSKTRDEFTELLEENGGTVASSVTKKVTHLITTAEDFANAPSKVATAQKNGIFIVNEDWVHDSISKGSAVDEAKYSLNGAKKRKVDDDEEEEEEEAKPAKKGAKKAKKEEAEEAEAKPKTRGRGKKAAAKEESEEEEEEEEEEVKPKKGKKAAPKKAAAKGKKAAAKAAEDDDEEEEEEEEKPAAKDDSVKKTVVVKGRAAVDEYSGLTKTAHVLEEGDEIYNSMLNQTNISQNNNKFYVIQVLEADAGGKFWCFNRWGRVGEPGQHKLEPYNNNKAGAITSFKKKFTDKTKNRWENRDSFKSVPGKYTLLEIDYGADAEPEEKKETKEKKPKRIQKTNSKLDERVQDLVKLIFDLKMMETEMMEMEFDVKKQPLGKLTKKQVKDGYEVLKELEAAISKKAGGSVLAELSSRFYTLIPHSFGRQVPPVINNTEKLKAKMNMLEALADIEIATKLMKQAEDSDENPIDTNYASLKCDIEPLDKNTEEFKNIEKYVKNTHQGSVPKIKNVYRIDREGEVDRFKNQTKIGNRKLLWHGSRLTNYVGIISQGLRIAPPEAPVSGYRFGKGIYFADIMSLSSIYCRSAGSNDFCMLLGDVVLGKEAELNHDTYMEKPPAGHNSTKALGTIEPSPKQYVNHPDGYTIPCGEIVNSGKTGVSCREHQYIVYDVSQVNLKYMLHLNWN